MTPEENAKLYEALTGQAVVKEGVWGLWFIAGSPTHVPDLTTHENFATIVRPGMRERGWRLLLQEDVDDLSLIRWWHVPAEGYVYERRVPFNAETETACLLAARALEAS